MLIKHSHRLIVQTEKKFETIRETEVQQWTILGTDFQVEIGKSNEMNVLIHDYTIFQVKKKNSKFRLLTSGKKTI